MLKVLRQYYPIRNILFVLVDGIFIFLSILAVSIFFNAETNAAEKNYILLGTFFITLICQILIYYTDLYEMKKSINFKEFVVKIFKAVIIIFLVLIILNQTFPDMVIKPEILATGFMLLVITIGANRFGYSWMLKQGFFNQKIILIGAGDLAEKIVTEIQEREDCGYEISFVVLNQRPQMNLFDNKTKIIQHSNYLGLCEVAKENGIKKIVVAIDEKRGNFPSEELLRCRIEGVEILEGNSFYEMLSGKLVVNQLYPSWLIFSDGFRKSSLNRIFKLSFDILLSLVMLILLLPLMVLVAIIIKIDSKGPVFYFQERVGRNHKPYNIYKFRSMVDNAEKKSGPQYASENDNRVTRVGYYLRKFRIDELPQLWNVLKGEMSFVGPRPERGYFVEQYEKQIPYYRERFSIKPGITGWAQICYPYGANTEDTIEKLNYDLFYIKNMSFLMDMMIMLKTIKIVIFGKGAR
jgi:sugar transferase (PEP-CTERM system associated)